MSYESIMEERGDREWADGDDSELYDRGYQDGLESQYERLYSLYADLEYAMLQDAEYGEPSNELVSTVEHWATELYQLGVMDDTKWKVAVNAIQSVGGFADEEEI